MADDTTETKPQTSEGEGKNTAGEATGAGTQTAKTEERTFSQADIDRIVKDRLAAQKKAIEEKQAEELAQKQGEWKDLAEKRAARVAELEAELKPLTERADSLEARLHKIADAELEKLPEKSRARVPDAKSASAEARLTKIEEILELVAELPTATPPAPGHGRGPKAAGGPSGPSDDKLVEDGVRRGIFGF
jgi:small-conductance mechanosensitive channel